MKDGHWPDRPALNRLEALTEDRRDALRASIAGFLAGEPERNDRGLELYLAQIEAAILAYLGLEPFTADSEENARHNDSLDREALALEFESLAAGARSLTSTLEALSSYSRDRLNQTTRLDHEALANLTRLCDLAASEAGVTRAQMLGEPRSRAASGADAERVFLEKLTVVWTRNTNQRVVRDREATTPWARFVEVACGIAGIEREYAHEVRLRAFDSAGLDESAVLLETVGEL